MDSYQNFATLSHFERPGIDFVVRLRWGRTGLAVLAPHGGRIEPGTSEIARSLAGSDHTLYEFAGIKPAGNRRLHLASDRFDEPHALEVLSQSRFVLLVHGCAGAGEVLYLGGSGPDQGPWIRQLRRLGLTVAAHPLFPGRHPRNLCNRLGRGRGVQMEFSAALRRRLLGPSLEGGKPGAGTGLDALVQGVRGLLAAAAGGC